MSASMRACKAAITASVCGLLSANVHAAGGAYVVDDATIAKVGECKVESWVSVASNGDFVGVTQPACVVRIGVPVEFTATLQPMRADAEWTTFAGVRGKFVLLREGPNNPAIAMAIGTFFDVTNGENITFVNVPLTIKVRDDLRLNLNAGWLRDSVDETNHLTWGGSVEWDFRKSWSLITEVFGLTGHQSEPRMQGGLRYSPIESVDLDLIYGHNLFGERANWITAGVTARF
jgi:hypothetical protein